jgi:transcriptional regulator with XRE-family HTH domain
VIQRLLGHETQAAFARELGITPARLGNIYNGAELSKEVAFRLRERVPGLTLDWLWFGYWAGTPVELARNLRQLLDGTQPMSGS